MSDLRRFRRLVTQSELVNALRDSRQFPDEAIEPGVALDDLEAAITRILEGEYMDTSIDQELVEPLWSALGSLSRRDASDMRVWHWLSVEKFPELVVKRWTQLESKDKLVATDKPVGPSLADHFLGNSTLNGFARNTFSRVWWVANTLGGNMESSRAVLGDADAFSGIFERFFGSFKPAANASVGRLVVENVPQDEQRTARRWLQQALGTTILEALDEEDIRQILNESLGSN